MSSITKTGTYRGIILDTGIATTKNGFPQWVAQLQAAEFYDEETHQWVDWTSYEEKDITLYAVLFGGESKPTLVYGQLQKVLGWSGISFSELAAMDCSQIKLQFRVDTNLYEGVTSLRVNWIDVYDAEPGRTVQKLDPDKVKELDAKYANALRQASGGPKPKKVEPVVPVSIPAPAKVKNKKVKSITPSIPEHAPPQDTDVCTKEDAWNSAYEVKPELMTDNQISEIWLKTIETMDGEKAIADWSKVRDAVIEQIKDEIPF